MKSILFTIAALFTGCILYSQTNATYTFDKQGRLKSELFESVYLLQFNYDIEGNLMHKSLVNYSDITKTQQITSSGAIEIYPNPAVDYVTVKVTEGLSVKKVSLYDISGRELDEWDVSASPAHIDVRRYEKGTYFLKTESDAGITVVKIVIGL